MDGTPIREKLDLDRCLLNVISEYSTALYAVKSSWV
jgi:hypothetical protein